MIGDFYGYGSKSQRRSRINVITEVNRDAILFKRVNGKPGGYPASCDLDLNRHHFDLPEKDVNEIATLLKTLVNKSS